MQEPTLTLVVQQLAALLRGGRAPGRLWDELWTVYSVPGQNGQRLKEPVQSRAVLSESSAAVLASARAAAATGAPVAEAIRRAVSTVFPARDREARTWSQLAACFDIAEASGCPLADVLTRFAAQLEAEDDADAARQTALAGPKATVRLLTWLPLMGLALGVALGVDPLATLLGTPPGLAALSGGAILTLTGRAWSARLVSAAAGAGIP
jgi:tight adherence protein B